MMKGGGQIAPGLECTKGRLKSRRLPILVCSRGGLVPASVQYLKAHAGKADMRLVNLDLIVLYGSMSKLGEALDPHRRAARTIGSQPS
jgi:hypothetical protein